MNINDEDALGFLNRLLEWLHQADLKKFGSHIQLVYVASGAQHVGNIQTQNVYVERRQEPVKAMKQNEENAFDEDTPLSALFRESCHEELRRIIETWRPCLIDDDASVDALKMTRFEFDKKRIYSNRVYYDLLDLEAVGALQVSLSQLSVYLAGHSNLSNSYATLYRQLKKYRQERA